jgi:hypothetical protein
MTSPSGGMIAPSLPPTAPSRGTTAPKRGMPAPSLTPAAPSLGTVAPNRGETAGSRGQIPPSLGIERNKRGREGETVGRDPGDGGPRRRPEGRNRATRGCTCTIAGRIGRSSGPHLRSDRFLPTNAARQEQSGISGADFPNALSPPPKGAWRCRAYGVAFPRLDRGGPTSSLRAPNQTGCRPNGPGDSSPGLRPKADALGQRAPPPGGLKGRESSRLTAPQTHRRHGSIPLQNPPCVPQGL